MRLSALTANKGGGGRLVGTRILLGETTPLYRKLLYLRIAVPAQTLAFHASETTFNVRFEPLDYDALTPTGLAPALKAKKFSVGKMLGLELLAPRRLIRVRGSQSSAVKQVNIHRLDMRTPSDKPTTTFSLEQIGGTQGLSVMQMEMPMLYGMVVVDANTGTQVGAAVSNEAPPTPQYFTDQRFALAAPDNSAASTYVKEVWVKSFPTRPRLSLAGSDLANPFGFWLEPGQHTSALTRSVGNAFADTLQRYVDRLETIPNPLDIVIIAESDAECVFEVTDFALLPRGVVSVFTDDQPKVTLNFERQTTATAAFEVPPGVTIQSAVVSAEESLREGRSSTLPPLGAAFHGVRLTEKYLAQSLTVDTALTVGGVRLGVQALQAPVVLNVEVQPDDQGRPSGKVAARTSITLSRAGDATWVTAEFNEAIILPSGAHWVVVQAAEGRAVWLTETADDAVTAVEKSAPNGVWERMRGIQTMRAMVALVWVGGSSPATPPVTLSVGGHAVGGSIVDEANSARLYTFTSPLVAQLGTGGSSTALTVTSYTRGLVTLKNLRIEFTT